MLSNGLIDGKTQLIKNQIDNYNHYGQMYTLYDKNLWAHVEPFVTDDIGILRKDKFIEAYKMIYNTTTEKAEMEYNKTISKRKDKIRN
jgi:hypothetical protein